MIDSNSTDELNRQISDLQSSINSLQTQVRLASLREKVGNLETAVSTLDQRVKDIRARGYIFEKELADQAADLNREWETVRPMVYSQIDQQSASLGQTLLPIEGQMTQLVGLTGDPGLRQVMLGQIKPSVSALQSEVSAAESSIQGMFGKFQSEADKLGTHLDQINWTLDQLAQATFQLLPSEYGIMAVKATWVQQDKESKDDPEGVLYLTDQRVLFEQKQEVATKKVLFITTEKQKVQKLLLQLAVGQVESAQASKQGLFGHEDHIELTAVPAAPRHSVHFHIDGQDCNLWQGLIGRAKAGDFDHDRVQLPDQTTSAPVKVAPSKCPQCGGTVTQPVLRGMNSLTCQYCGYVIPL